MTNAPCPSLAIPKKYKFKVPEKITMPNYNKKRQSTAPLLEFTF
jgi:hypothetical protein